MLPLVSLALERVVGDAARYLHVAPRNIEQRHAIRSAGIELLRELHERDYERIVVVGHSLGSVIGYDVLTHAWARWHERHSRPERPAQDALAALEQVLDEPATPSAGFPRRYERLQADYLAELQGNGLPWRVTHFITLGSPLTHASLLLADGSEDLARRQRDRELPTCPPVREEWGRRGRRRLWFRLPYRVTTTAGKARTRVLRAPHHAAAFAATRWTNLYFPSRFLVWGDVIGGPLAESFGRGIRDVAVRARAGRGLLTHTRYWADAEDSATGAAVPALRVALDLCRERGAD